MTLRTPLHSRRGSLGFTLLEAIVTLVVVSLLVTILMQALSHSLSLRARLLRFQGESRIAVLQEAWFRETIAGAQTDSVDGMGQVQGTGDSLSYATPAPLVARGMSRVRWWVESGPEGESLHYSDPATKDLVVVAGPLRDASFSYLNHEGEWQEEWKPEPEDIDVLPQLVRFEAMTTKGSLFWLVPLIADPLPPESMRLEGMDSGI